MARITGFEPDPRRPGAVRVLVDGRPFCTVHEGAADAGLRVGGEWDDRQQAVAGQAADEEAAWRAALRSPEFRSFAVAELRRRLRLKGHPPAAVDYAVGRAQGPGCSTTRPTPGSTWPRARPGGAGPPASAGTCRPWG